MDEITGAEILFRCVRDTLLEQGADVSSHPFDMLAIPDKNLWVAAWRRLSHDLEIRSNRVNRWRKRK